jgi:thiamine biosynthesis lipoprotein
MEFDDGFRAMDTEIDVVIETGARPFDAFAGVRLLFEQQEQRFSRFRPASLLCALNRGDVVDDPWFAAACRLALDAHAFTGGRFNPMVLPALAEAGYSSTFSEVRGGAPRRQAIPDPNQCLEIVGTKVRLIRGAVDFGGIVKGWTVDLAVETLGDRYGGVLVNAGGDLRCAGNDAGGDAWTLAVEAPRGAAAWEGAIRGALATSTSAKRRWRTGDGGSAHHLIDPATGMPSESAFVQASAWAPECWRAECWAKAVLIGGELAGEAAVAAGVTALAVTSSGDERWFGLRR